MKELDHELYMRRAIELAGNVPEHPFGTVIVDRDTGKIVAEGWNKSRLNPTWHGEIDAINQLILAVPEIDRKKLVLYSNAEPCPMCQAAIIWTGDRNGCLRHLDSVFTTNGMATDRHSGGRSDSFQSRVEMCNPRRDVGAGVQRPV